MVAITASMVWTGLRPVVPMLHWSMDPVRCQVTKRSVDYFFVS